MSKALKILYGTGFALLALATLLVVILIVANRIDRAREVREITSTTILEEIQEQYFVVTKTVIVDQDTEILIDEGSPWSNFLWGQTITAEALIRVDVGVDMNKLQEADIQVNYDDKIITVNLPDAEVLDASQFGDINVDTQSGILRFLLDRDPNRDHNLALDQLIREAEASVLTDATLFEEARENSVQLLELIVRDIGYTITIE